MTAADGWLWVRMPILTHGLSVTTIREQPWSHLNRQVMCKALFRGQAFYL